MPELEPVEPLVDLLRDIRDGRVHTADDFAVMRQIPGEPDQVVTEMAGEIERLRWAIEPAQRRTWEPTLLGRQVLDGAP